MTSTNPLATSTFSSTSSIDGLVSGLNTTDIISKLMSLEAAPQNALKNQKTAANAIIDAYQAINTKFAALQTAADALNSAAGWQAFQATSSSSSVTATAGSGALSGSLTFTVDQLAKANVILNTTTFSSLTSSYGTAPILLSKASALGFASLDGSGLTVGSHSIQVTQASAAATKSGGSALAGSTVITAGVNDTIDVTVNGTPTTLTLAAGTYTPSQLAAQVAAASGGALTATADANNVLQIATAKQGSSASIQVTGGTALTDLGLTTDVAAATGTDALVNVDGTVNTITDTTAPITLTSGTGGTITATLAGAGISLGSTTATNVSVGDGSLQSVVSAINNANAGFTATAIQSGTNAYRLQLSSTTTGASSTLTIPPSGWTTVTAGQDAQLTVGSGPSAFNITSASNTLSNVLPGVTLTLNAADPNTPVTVNVAADGNALADKVAALASAANDVLSTIAGYTGFDTSTNTAGVLLGDSTITTLQSKVVNSIIDSVSGNALGSAGFVGLKYNSDGSVSFDRNAFLTAYQANPTGVAALFQQGGTATSSKVALQSAPDGVQPGTYAVTVTTAADHAQATGATLAGGTITNAETIDLRVGSTTVTYSATAGESLSSIASGLSNLASASSLGVVATVENNQLVLRTVGYGTGATFDVRTSDTSAGQTGIASTAGQWETHNGVDVAGTINGVAATGLGQFLTAPNTDPTIPGLSLLITATPADVASSTDFGTFTYVPGIAQRLASLGNAATQANTGTLTSAIAGEQSYVSELDDQISAWDTRLADRQAYLQQQYAQLEVQLGQLKALSTSLASSITQITANSTTTTTH